MNLNKITISALIAVPAGGVIALASFIVLALEGKAIFSHDSSFSWCDISLLFGWTLSFLGMIFSFPVYWPSWADDDRMQ